MMALQLNMKTHIPVVVIVDQSVDDRILLARYLARSNFIVHEAGCLEDMLQNINQANPDLVIVAERMVPINGYDMCRLIRKEKTVHIPYILMMLEMQDEYNAYHAILSGADDYIIRPDIASDVCSYHYIKKFIYENISMRSSSS